MLRLTQIMRNLFLRFEGFFGVVVKTLLSFIGNLFGFFARIFGLTKSDYFLESNDAQGVKQAAAKESIPKSQDKTSEPPATTRRLKNAKIDDYYLNMAREVKKN